MNQPQAAGGARNGTVNSRVSEERGRSLDPVAQVGLWMVLAPALVDYRFQQPTAASLAMYAVITLCAVLGCATVVVKFGLKHRSSINTGAMISAAFLAGTCLVGLLRGQDPMTIARGAPAVLFLPIGLLTVSAIAASGADPRKAWRVIVQAAGAALMIQIGFALFVRGIDLSTVRYQILSGAAPLLSAVAVAGLLFGGLTLRGWLLISAHAATILLSVTRTQILVAAVASLGAFIFSAGGARHTLGRAALGAGVLVLTVLLAGILLPGAPVERWANRLFTIQQAHGGIDITAVARAGEARFQVDRLLSGADELLFGLGLAAPTAFDQRTARIVEFILGQQASTWGEIGFGHNNYVGTLYVGGLLAGGLLIVYQLRTGWWSSRAIWRLTRPSLLASYRDLIACPLAVFAYLTVGALSGTFGSRSSTTLFAICIGVTIWIYEATRMSTRHRPAS